MKDLVPVEVKNVPALFKTGGTKALIDSVEAQVRAEVYEVETKAGQAHVRSVAANLKRLKSHLDDMGKTYVAELKALPKLVDAERRAMRDRLDALAEEIRAPLTALEQSEQERLRRINERIGAIHEHCYGIEDMPSEKIAGLIADVRAIDMAQFAEHFETAESAIRQTLDRLQRAMQNNEEREIFQAEQKKLMAEKAALQAELEKQRIRDEALEEARAKARAEEDARREAAVAYERKSLQEERDRALAEMRAKLDEERAQRMREREEEARKQAEAIEAARASKVVYAPGDPAPLPMADDEELLDFPEEGPDDCRDSAVNDLIELGLEEHVAEDVVNWIMAGRVSHILADWMDESGYWSE